MEGKLLINECYRPRFINNTRTTARSSKMNSAIVNGEGSGVDAHVGGGLHCVAAIDVQGFYINNKFIAKEVAILDYEWKLAHFLLKPPVDIRVNTAKDFRQIRWLYENYHGIRWSDGHVDYEEIQPIIAQYLNQYATIYVCGQQKEQFVQSLGLLDDVNIIDMKIVGDDFNRLSEMTTNDNNRCLFHKKTLKNMCAIKNVYNIAAYFYNKGSK